MDAYRIKIGLFIVSIGLLGSCVKDPQDIPGTSSEDEVFGIMGTFGNEVINIGAGKDQWTNLPVVTQGDSLVIYSSVLSLNGCLENCPSSWTFNFYQALPETHDPVLDFHNTIRVGEKAIVTSDIERLEYEILLSTHPGIFMSGYSFWEDLNNSSSSFFHEYQSVVGFEEIIDVCFQSMAYTGCMYKQCISFDPATNVPCLSRIEPRLETPRYLSLNLQPSGTAPFDILWSNGSTSQSIVVPLQDSVAEIYAQVTVVDALGNSSSLAQSIRVQNSIVDACYFPIELTSNPILNESPESFEDRVEIKYIDEDGTVWSSSAGVQPESSHLTIDEKTNYGISPLSQLTYLVEMTADIVLYNETTNEPKLFITERLSLALSHP